MKWESWRPSSSKDSSPRSGSRAYEYELMIGCGGLEAVDERGAAARQGCVEGVGQGVVVGRGPGV